MQLSLECSHFLLRNNGQCWKMASLVTGVETIKLNPKRCEGLLAIKQKHKHAGLGMVHKVYVWVFHIDFSAIKFGLCFWNVMGALDTVGQWHHTDGCKRDTMDLAEIRLSLFATGLQSPKLVNVLDKNNYTTGKNRSSRPNQEASRRSAVQHTSPPILGDNQTKTWLVVWNMFYFSLFFYIFLENDVLIGGLEHFFP